METKGKIIRSEEYQSELSAANKTIVALSEVLATYLECYYADGGLNMPILSDEQIANGHKIALIYDTEQALTTYAPAIEKARGG